MQEEKLSFNYETRFFLSGAPHATIQRIVMVFHGYGMLGKFFLKKFKPLFDDQTLFIAPEGLHKFYKEGFAGRVGASWMTSEDRMVDIHNYLKYLDGIKRGVLDQFPEAEITLLGFSQGAATVSRWVMHGEVNWQQLILWGGLWPPDLPFELGREKLTGKAVYFVYGKNDPFFKPEHLDTLVELSTKLNVSPFIRPFDGGHEIDLTVLSEILSLKR